MSHIRPQETVDKALRMSDAGVLDRDVAAPCGVAIKTVRRWRRLYQRQGRARGGQHSSVPCPRCEQAELDRRAYAELLGWYLGDGHIVAYKRGVYFLAIFNDRKYQRLNDEILELFKAVKPGGRPFTRRMPGLINTGCYWKHWPCLFPQHGPGMKHTRKIELEPWQQDIVEEHPGRFLRGLFNSDGCRIENWTVKTVNGAPKRYAYTRYLFRQRSTDIMGLCQWALGLVGVRWTMPKPDTLSVARKPDVALLDEFIGPKS
jgi:hypothetical protein